MFHCRMINLTAIPHRYRARHLLHIDIKVNNAPYISLRENALEQSIMGNPLREDFLPAYSIRGRCVLPLDLSSDPPFRLLNPRGHNL